MGNLLMSEMPMGVPKEHHRDDFDNYVSKGTNVSLANFNGCASSLHGFVPNHAFFITEKGYLGVGPADAQQGDNVCVFGGGRVPFLVRCVQGNQQESREEERCYQLVGDVYVHGIMRGEMEAGRSYQARMMKLV